MKWTRRIRCVVLAALVTALGPVGCTVMDGTRDPCPPPGSTHGPRVELELNGVSQGTFDEVSGLGSETDVVLYREGADTSAVRKLPGQRKYTNISLKRGYLHNKDLWAWYEEIGTGVVKRRDGAIIFLDAAGTRVLRYEFFAAWPAKWKGPTLTSENDEVAIEEIEFAVEGIDRVQ